MIAKKALLLVAFSLLVACPNQSPITPNQNSIVQVIDSPTEFGTVDIDRSVFGGLSLLVNGITGCDVSDTGPYSRIQTDVTKSTMNNVSAIKANFFLPNIAPSSQTAPNDPTRPRYTPTIYTGGGVDNGSSIDAGFSAGGDSSNPSRDSVVKNNNQSKSKSFIYENIRVTVTKRGVIGGDVNTGKVIWRSGFDPNPENYIIINNTKFFGAYLFYLISGRVSGGTFLETKTGKQITFVKDFYLKEGDFYYFNDITFTNIVDRSFADIAIFEFDSKTKKMKEVTFIADQYLDPETRVYCVSTGPEYFDFVSKAKNIWKFKYSGRKCEIEVEFDYSNLQKFSFKIRKKG